MAVENYLECYHCAVAHPGFSDLVDVSTDAYRLERHATFASHHVRTRDGKGGGQFHMIWPSTKVNIFPGAPNVSIGPLTPAGVGRTDGFLDYFFLADADPAEMAELIELDDEVGAEDRVLVESVQRGTAGAGLRARPADAAERGADRGLPALGGGRAGLSLAHASRLERPPPAARAGR